MTPPVDRIDPRLAHFLAFFSRILLMAVIPAYIIRESGQGQETLSLWLGIIGTGGILFVVSSFLYYTQGRGSKRLVRMDALYIGLLFGLPLILPFDPMAVGLLAETGALVTLARMNFLFVARWPSTPNKEG